MHKQLLRQWIAISCLAILVTACGGGGGGGSSSSSTPTAQTPSSSPSSPSPQTGNYSVHLTWVAPSTRADGSALAASDIAGYRLFYILDGSSSSADTVVAISGGSTTSTDLSLTSTGTYTFAITAVDSNGAESALSSPVSLTIN